MTVSTLARVIVLLVLAMFGFAPSAFAQGGHQPAPSPIEGEWDATETQQNTGTQQWTVCKIDNVLRYERRDDAGNVIDEGTLIPQIGGDSWMMNSDNVGGTDNGLIQSNGDGTYAWQFFDNSQGGVLTAH